MRHKKNAVSRLADTVKSNWRLFATGTVATAAILTLAASSATAAGMIGRGDLTDTLRADVNNVFKSEFRAGGDLNNVFSSEIFDGGVHEQDLSEGVQDKLNATGGGAVEEVPITEDELGEDLASKVNTDEVGPNLAGYEVIGPGNVRKSGPGTYTAIVTCFNTDNPDDPHKVAVGGGIRIKSGADTFSNVTVHQDGPAQIERVGGNDDVNPSGLWAATAWTVSFTIAEETDATVQPYALCATKN